MIFTRSNDKPFYGCHPKNNNESIVSLKLTSSIIMFLKQGLIYF